MVVTDFRCGFRGTQRKKFIRRVTNAKDRERAVWLAVMAAQAHIMTDSMVGVMEEGNQSLYDDSLFSYLPENGGSFTSQACNWAL